MFSLEYDTKLKHEEETEYNTIKGEKCSIRSNKLKEMESLRKRPRNVIETNNPTIHLMRATILLLNNILPKHILSNSECDAKLKHEKETEYYIIRRENMFDQIK